MNYTLRQLQIFLKLAQTLSFTKAAEELHLTQPAVSLQLKNLQTQFDLPLFEVVGKKVYITDFGQEIATAAEKILEEAYAIDAKTHAHKGQLTGRLKISVVSTGKYVMPYFLSEFLQLNPGVELVMDVTNKTEVIRTLEQNEVDFALVSVVPDTIKTEGIKLMQNKLYLVGNGKAQHKRIVDKSIIENLPLIYREMGSATRNAMERFISKNHVPVRRKIELTSNEAVKQAVIAGLGYSIMPLIGIKNELNSGDLKIIKIKGLPMVTNWQLVWAKHKKFTTVAQHYIDFIRQQKEQIIQSKFDWFENY